MMNTQTSFAKRALRRRPGYPVGQPAPMFIACGCGTEVDVLVGGGELFECKGCQTVYDRRGYIQPSFAEREQSAPEPLSLYGFRGGRQ